MRLTRIILGMMMASVVLFIFFGVVPARAEVDLVAESISWNPNPVNSGDEVAITFTVRNNGPDDFNQDFHVQLTRDGQSTRMCDWMVWGGLVSGAEYTRTCSIVWGIPSATSPGHTIRLAADDTLMADVVKFRFKGE